MELECQREDGEPLDELDRIALQRLKEIKEGKAILRTEEELDEYLRSRGVNMDHL